MNDVWECGGVGMSKGNDRERQETAEKPVIPRRFPLFPVVPCRSVGYQHRLRQPSLFHPLKSLMPIFQRQHCRNHR